MILRQEIEPKTATARSLYPEILRLLLEYADDYEKSGDESSIRYASLESTLHQLTGKDISAYNLWEWWEEEGAETLAYIIALPLPVKTENITRDELIEIIHRLKHTSDSTDLDEYEAVDYQFIHCIHEYYFNFLKINFKKYKYSFFNRQQDANGKYFELSSDDIANKIWNE
ncbi:hypothetical protein [Hymenobacter actinosclerus]|uniref:Uncharacterized protein n=1 Tax=Hymenobacter actinosclerus TaxID=82805 RepID=A0A1I0DJA9_9BACT|nr:hypothetical protein [Hymenobacter actinosclerus]SET31891.1 hypothetical protein SAMN04487998_1407 [Hymenobacter actinosclerus]